APPGSAKLNLCSHRRYSIIAIVALSSLCRAYYSTLMHRYTRAGVPMTEARIVLTTARSAHEAPPLAGALVGRRLAACVNIVPQIESVYRWQGKVERAAEWLLIIKTQASAFGGVRATIEALHSYELPECVLLEVADGKREYLNWIAANVD